MFRLDQTLAAWPGPTFTTVAKAEIEALDADLLPLQQALAHSSHALPERLSVRILAAHADAGRLLVKAGLQYAGIVAGCSCADDPTPLDEIAEYCEVLFGIDRASGTATVELLE